LANYSVSQDISIDCMWNITVKPGYKVWSKFFIWIKIKVYDKKVLKTFLFLISRCI
jgi:hypothetical protein